MADWFPKAKSNKTKKPLNRKLSTEFSQGPSKGAELTEKKKEKNTQLPAILKPPIWEDYNTQTEVAVPATWKPAMSTLDKISVPIPGNTDLGRAPDFAAWTPKKRSRSLHNQTRQYKYPSFEPPVYILHDETIDDYLERLYHLKGIEMPANLRVCY